MKRSYLAGILIVAAVIAATMNSRAQADLKPTAPTPRTSPAECAVDSLSRRLADICEREDSVQFAAILEAWHAAYPPNSRERSTENDTLRHAYELFSDYYTAICNEEKYKDPYFIVQNTLHLLLCVNEQEFTSSKQSVFVNWERYRNMKVRHIVIREFRPEVRLGNAKVLYVDTLYFPALNRLFDQEKQNQALNAEPKEGTPEAEYLALIERRDAFISKFFCVDRDTWDAIFSIREVPSIIEAIEFNKTFDQAVVRTDEWHYGETTLVIRRNGRWEKLERLASWIE